MDKGEEAVKKLAEMDRSRGLQDPVDVARRMRGESTDPKARNKPPVTQPTEGMLGDSDLARQRLEQALRMEREANGLLSESQRLMNEAYSMDPSLSPKTASKPVRKKTKTTPEVMPTPVKKSGRPRKETVTG